MDRRSFLAACLAPVAGCAPPAGTVTTSVVTKRVVTPPIAGTLRRGVAYLLSQQVAGGAFASDTYAAFRDGTALTPLVLHALQRVTALADLTADARRKAVNFLTAFTRPDGTLNPGPDGFAYPVYTAALATRTLQGPARDAFRRELLARQLTEAHGWTPAEAHYGGWGYYPGVPRKPAPGVPVPAHHLLESNLSATRFALQALAACGPLPADVATKAAAFVARMQTPDGGYHFVTGDPVRNKAGQIDGVMRSYGSATADGLLCERLLGQPGTRPRAWLREHARADRHPGDYVPAHEANRDAVYFYYAAAVTEALPEVRPALSECLAETQSNDGSWSNRLELVREDDPVLATTYAVLALAEPAS